MIKYNFKNMSHAFIRESDDQMLDQIPPTLSALILYLTRENNGIKSYEKKRRVDEESKKEVFEMSNGLSYSIDMDGKWFMVG
ncbi:MAG: hypothetical protein H7296_03350 [Bacteroidia bacterium]|nr:hypothetical protein [Bacteroidia bacterium]